MSTRKKRNTLGQYDTTETGKDDNETDNKVDTIKTYRHPVLELRKEAEHAPFYIYHMISVMIVLITISPWMIIVARTNFWAILMKTIVEFYMSNFTCQGQRIAAQSSSDDRSHKF